MASPGEKKKDELAQKRAFMVDKAQFIVDARYCNPILLGVGSYGVVCSAEDKKRGRKRVAIKQIPHAFDSTVDARHVLREVRLMRILRHPNIVPLKTIDEPLDYKSFKDIYLISPLSDFDLDGLLTKRHYKLETREVQWITCQILRALKYIHSAHIVHRDLKPGNIVLSEDLTVQLCDLGLARYIDPDEESGLTKNVSTKSYRAPEVFLCGEVYDHKIDLWAVGLMLYEMLSGAPLFRKAFKSQVDAIIALIGTPSPEETEFLSEWAKWFLKKSPVCARVSFSEQLPGADRYGVDLVSNLLRFDPKMRISADDALAHPFLAEFHDSAKEPSFEEPLHPEEYEPADVGRDGKKVTKDDLKRMVWKEVERFHPDVSKRYNGKH
eukprot:CAMPEP_0184677898 /NCGR_PEP_ID=MMETSP0312-20130426/510_1 /TAXON_ID=31354 /ORGANISM="Compsopogon coeruleus, Strain SAG 36.94" /LENGTH=380 /DNA_ID=CAMNT_0027126099 /DNA_START=52 /DNA_END=1194 /DNA_ORIENTATION=+